MNPWSSRVCGGNSSSGEGGGSVVNRGAARVREDNKRKDSASPAVTGETPSESERTSIPAVVKVEEGLAMFALSGAAEAVRYVCTFNIPGNGGAAVRVVSLRCCPDFLRAFARMRSRDRAATRRYLRGARTSRMYHRRDARLLYLVSRSLYHRGAPSFEPLLSSLHILSLLPHSLILKVVLLCCRLAYRGVPLLYATYR